MSPTTKKKPHFCKFFLPGVTDQSLRIPPAFLKNIDNGGHGTVSLMGPSGNAWHVNLVENVNGFFFRDGWKEFARFYNLQVGYFLVFRYDGNLHFTVQIFDTSGCEKGVSSYAKSCLERSGIDEDKQRKIVKEEASMDLNSSPGKDNEGVLSGKHDRVAIQDTEDEKPVNSYKRRTAMLSCRSQTNYLTMHDKQLAEESVHKEHNSSKRYVTRSSCQVCWRCSTKSTRQSVQQPSLKKPASSTKSGMKKPPQRVQSNYITTYKKEATPPNRSVTQRSRQTRYSNQLAVRRPLYKKPATSTKSTTNNRLAARRCLFKKRTGSTTISAKKPSHQVTSNTLVQYEKQQVQGFASKRNIRQSPEEIWQSLRKKPTISAQGSTQVASHQVQSNSLMLCVGRSNRHKKAVRLCNGAFKSQRRSVTKEERARALDNAKSFKPENPSVAIVMRGSYVYVGFQMSFPRRFLTSHLPKANREMTVWDPSGKCWTINYNVSGRRGYLSRGWSFLSFANNIEEDDVCIFELIKTHEMRVHIFRVVEEITPLIKIVSHP